MSNDENAFNASISEDSHLAGSRQIGLNDSGTCEASDTPLTQRRSPDVPWGYTYFVRRGDAIKVGHSAIPKQRISGLQVSFPEPLEVLAIIENTIISEAAAHAKFAHLRMTGEWFRAEPELIEFIEAMKVAPKPTPKFVRKAALKEHPVITCLSGLNIHPPKVD